MSAEVAVVAIPRRRSLRVGLTSLAIVLVAVVAIAYFGVSAVVADKLSHPTRKALQSACADFGPNCHDVQFTATDGVPLKGWFIDSPGNTTAILKMHGRNGNRADQPEVTQALAQHGYDVLVFDFRAHGESGGDRYSLGPMETQDVAGALRYLQSRGETRIGTLGYSMGAATELLAAPDHPEMEAVVADSAFADLPELLQKELPRNSGLPDAFNPGIMLTGKLLFGIDLYGNKPKDAVARLGSRPLFIIHSNYDELVPVSHAYELQEAASGDPNLQFWIAPGSGHTRAYNNNPQEYLERLFAFFDSNLK